MASELSDSMFDAPSSLATGASRPTWVRYQVLASACVLAVITYIHRVGFATASAEFKAPLGLSDGHIGYVMAAFMVAYGLFEVPWGLLGDRLGVRNLLAVSVLGGSLTTAGVALVVLLPGGLGATLAFLIVLRFLFGAFQAGTFPSVSRMMADWMPTTERGLAQGLIWTSSRLGGAVVPITLVALFKAVGNWPAPLVIVAGLGLLWVALWWPWFRNRPEQMTQVNALELQQIIAGRASAPPVIHEGVPWGRMLRSRSVWALCGMYGFLGYSGNFFITLLPTYLKNHRHLNPGQTGLLTSLPFACGVVACLLGGWLSDVIIHRTGSRRWGRRLVGAVGMTMGAASILAINWVQPTWLLAVLLCLTFFGNDLAMGPAWAAAADIGERYAGTLGGAMNMAASFAAAVNALVTGALFDRHLLSLPFLIFAVCYALGVLCWLAVDVRQTLGDVDPADA
ncbi:MAG TPA: MFS transporter [Isosphaeraceae bacterium]|jgi:sugar phosphate permease|nr:MFS transporter [Isosphaeraceae bacterium]